MEARTFSFKILPEFNIIIRSFKGTVYLSDVIYSQEALVIDKNFKATMNILNDVSHAKIEIKGAQIKALIDTIKANNNFYDTRKSVLLTKEPNQVAFGFLLDTFKNEQRIRFSIVSTLETALSKLGIPEENLESLSDTLSELRKDNLY